MAHPTNLRFSSPLLFISIFFLNSVLIGFVENKAIPAWWGYLIAVLMFFAALLQTLILHQQFHYSLVTGMRLRTGIIGIIYRKVRTCDYSCKDKLRAGNIYDAGLLSKKRGMWKSI